MTLAGMRKRLPGMDRAIVIDPNYALVLYEKGYTLRKIHRHEEAIRNFDSGARH